MLAPLLVAFAVGIVLSLSVVWIYDKRDLFISGKQCAVAPTSVGERPAFPPASAKRHTPQGAAPSHPASTTNGAVASALVDLRSLPYEESRTASLDERIRQVDYALMQAAWLRKIPASGLRLAAVEDRLEGLEPYQHQVIDVLPGEDLASYREALENSLAAWAEGAVLQSGSDAEWRIAVDGVGTHRIRLFPGRIDFPQRSQEDASRAASPAPPAPTVASRASRTVFERRGESAFGQSPKLVIVMDDLGASPAATAQLLSLNYPVTFAFWPHGSHTRQGALAAHRAGREILIHQPMEPLAYPGVKPGPNALFVGMNRETIRAILDAAIAAVPHAVGLNNHMGSRFTQNGPGVDAVIELLRERRLFMLDSLTHDNSVFAYEGRRLGIEHYQRNVFLDVTATRASILKELRRAEKIARLTGSCVAIGHPLPQTLAALKEWQQTRDTGIAIVRLREL